jgi:hypothetical protein
MNSPFILTNEKKNIFTVSWPTMADIRHVDYKIKLMKVLFSELKILDEVGFVIRFNQEELNVMWVSSSVYDTKSEIDNYMQDYYEIIGVAFRKVKDAESFKEWLEKKLVWKILND